MPVRNCVGFVAQTIKSLLGQTLTNIEVICIDDASDDGTSEILEFYKKDERIRVYRNKEWMGGAWSRNFGNGKAKAKVICVTDAGDVYHKYKAHVVYDYFKRNDVDVLYHAVNVVDIMGTPLYTQLAEPYDYKNHPRGISHPTVAYKKKVAVENKYRTDCKHTDQYEALFIDLFKRGFKFAHIPNVLLIKYEIPKTRDMDEAWKKKREIYKEFGVANI